VQLETNKGLRIESRPTEETGDISSQNALESTQEPVRLKIRDLHPEKDPMGASRNLHRKTDT